jgi:two-component system sensor histidine kinase PilS (NtrC family)
MPRPPRDLGLHRKLVWLTLFRIITVTVLLGGTLMVSWNARVDAYRELAPLYVVIVASYVVSIVFAVALRQRIGLVPIAYGQVVLDVAVAAGVVALTGRSESVFVFLFSLAVVNGAILLFRPGAIVAAVLSISAYLGVALWGGSLVWVPTLFAHAGAFVATAVLATYLAQLLQVTGERLAARESDLATITALHEAIVQSMTGGLLTLDHKGRVTFLNRAGEQVMGRSMEQVVGRQARDEFPMFGERVARDEIDFTSLKGTRLRLGYSSFPLQDRAGRMMGTAVIFQDLTQLRAMEEAMERSQRLADLGRVAAGLAHELRNPLASLSGSIELLRDQAGEDERRLLGIALREAERLDDLVTDFLRFARPPPIRRERVDLAALLAETLEVFARDPAAAGVQIERELRVSEADCDPGQIRQVAWNLLLNAAQALAGRGTVRVRCAPVEDGDVRFEVEDDGPGIADADQPRIFLPFHTTKSGGTGLGLATVQRIVDAHAGSVTVRSHPGEGTRFTVRLPSGGANGPGPG